MSHHTTPYSLADEVMVLRASIEEADKRRTILETRFGDMQDQLIALADLVTGLLDAA